MVPTKKIPELTLYSSATLQGSEELEIASVEGSRKVPSRRFVLPIDSLVTFIDQTATLPGSRFLADSPTVIVEVGPPGGFVRLHTAGGATMPTGLQTAALAAGANNNFVLDPDIGFLDLDTTAGAASLSGIEAGLSGQFLTVTNVGANMLTLLSMSGLSALDARIRLPTDIVLVPNGSAMLRYSIDLDLWTAVV